MGADTQWQVSSDTRVIVQPEDEWDPPRLFMADASTSVTLMPPTDRDTYPAFMKFLEELADAARELAVVCQSRDQM